MGTPTEGQRLARMAKIRLYSHDDGGPAYSVHWHWQGWDDRDGTVLDQSGGSYTGDADEVCAKVMALMIEMHRHMLRGIDPFPEVIEQLARFEDPEVAGAHQHLTSVVTPRS